MSYFKVLLKHVHTSLQSQPFTDEGSFQQCLLFVKGADVVRQDVVDKGTDIDHLRLGQCVEIGRQVAGTEFQSRTGKELLDRMDVRHRFITPFVDVIIQVCTYLYYGVGMMVIAFISGTVINVNLIMEMSNMILQTIALLLLVFLCWLHEAEDKHIGFIIIIIYHIVAGTLFSWLPLTQGLYISHMTSQPECMVFQMAECLVIGTGVAVILKNKQEYIILRKWKAENI